MCPKALHFLGCKIVSTMAAKGQIEITVKFDRIPLADRDHKGYRRIEIFCEGYVVLADIKTKTYKRFLERTREFIDWQAALTGKLHHIQGHQLILSNAGLQCYEKKQRADD